MTDKPYEIGVMQGRLLPKYQGRYQAHPIGYWQDEFTIARGLGLDLIECILDFNDAEKNPLLNRAGIEEIARLSNETGVLVKTICADYFMEAPLHSVSERASIESSNVLQLLIGNASMLPHVRDIVIPCVDQSSLKDEEEVLRFVKNITPSRVLAEKRGIRLCLETDLAPAPFADLLYRLDSKVFSVNYDTGNSAALGYDAEEELAAYGSRVTDIHIKDRLRGGGSVELGTGDTDFPRFFKTLSHVGYRGPFIMQAFRDDEGVQIFRKQLEWIKPWLTAFPPHKELG
jgi:L-ribulose-5-phosphate 3-epimerase